MLTYPTRITIKPEEVLKLEKATDSDSHEVRKRPAAAQATLQSAVPQSAPDACEVGWRQPPAANAAVDANGHPRRRKRAKTAVPPATPGDPLPLPLELPRFGHEMLTFPTQITIKPEEVLKLERATDSDSQEPRELRKRVHECDAMLRIARQQDIVVRLRRERELALEGPKYLRPRHRNAVPSADRERETLPWGRRMCKLLTLNLRGKGGREHWDRIVYRAATFAPPEFKEPIMECLIGSKPRPRNMLYIVNFYRERVWRLLYPTADLPGCFRQKCWSPARRRRQAGKEGEEEDKDRAEEDKDGTLLILDLREEEEEEEQQDHCRDAQHVAASSSGGHAETHEAASC